MNTCSTCHWWFNGFGSTAERRVCVFHTGMANEPTRRIDFGGKKPLRTVGHFGCTDWEKDTREKQDAKIASAGSATVEANEPERGAGAEVV